jgi:hypothetical protein
VNYEQTKRTQAEADLNAKKGIGISNSLHTIGLAVDLNLFIADKIQTNSEAYRPLGKYWKSLDPLCRWGGDFKDANGKPKPDGMHFSLEHLGVK